MNHTERPSGARLFGLIVLAIFFPPISVAIEYGIQSKEVLWNLLLWIFIPFGGFIHAIIVLSRARYDRPSYASSGRPYSYNTPRTATTYASAAPAAESRPMHQTEQSYQPPAHPPPTSYVADPEKQ